MLFLRNLTSVFSLQSLPSLPRCLQQPLQDLRTLRIPDLHLPHLPQFRAMSSMPPSTGPGHTSDVVHKPGTDDGWHGQIKEGGEFPPEKNRYHLYIGLFCPFAHRANLVRYLYGYDDDSIISLSVVKPYPKGQEGWRFDASYPDATPDHLFGAKFLHEIYFKADPEYKGRYSVPVLWDKKSNNIVNNESAELLRWLPGALDSVVGEQQREKNKGLDLYPKEFREKIDEITPWMQDNVNRGVYKAGFANDQETYDKAVVPVFVALNKLEHMLHENGGPYVLGKQMTELDVRLYATLVRFDAIYVQHFKCNLGTIRHEYPVLNNWLKNLYHNVHGYKESTNFKHIKENVGHQTLTLTTIMSVSTPLSS